MAPEGGVAAEPMVRPGTSVASVKLDADTPLAKAVLFSVTVTAALFKLPSTRGIGLVAETAADGGSNCTVTPLVWSAGMWVWIAATLSRLVRKSTLSPVARPAFATNAEMSAMVFCASLSDDRAVKVDRCEMFEIWLSERYSCVSDVKPDKWERSEIMLPDSLSRTSAVKPDRVEMSEIELSDRYNVVSDLKLDKWDISEIMLLDRLMTLSVVSVDKWEMSESELL